MGGGDNVTMKTRGDELNGQFCTFEVSTTPGFGPPLHTHAWAEFFYVLEGEYEFQRVVDGEVETMIGGPGATLSVPADVPHTFRNATSGMARMLIVHSPARTGRLLRGVRRRGREGRRNSRRARAA